LVVIKKKLSIKNDIQLKKIDLIFKKDFFNFGEKIFFKNYKKN
jgi:hypothetical protein